MRLMIARGNFGLAEQNASALGSVGLGADCFESLGETIEAVRVSSYDLLLLDSRFADGSAVDWLRRRDRQRLPSSTFVMVLSDREEDRVAALEAGADECAFATISTRELVARVQALLRRPRERATTRLVAGDIAFCTDSREASIDDHPVAMPRRELAILELLLRRAGRVVSRAALEHDVYGINTSYGTNSLEVRISRLRRHLADAGSSVAIEAVRGVGYRLVPDAAAPVGLVARDAAVARFALGHRDAA